eukprot:UN08408
MFFSLGSATSIILWTLILLFCCILLSVTAFCWRRKKKTPKVPVVRNENYGEIEMFDIPVFDDNNVPIEAVVYGNDDEKYNAYEVQHNIVLPETGGTLGLLEEEEHGNGIGHDEVNNNIENGIENASEEDDDIVLPETRVGILGEVEKESENDDQKVSIESAVTLAEEEEVYANVNEDEAEEHVENELEMADLQSFDEEPAVTVENMIAMLATLEID